VNLSKRIESLENKSTPGNRFTVIQLKKGETKEQALKRYCSENDVTAEELEHPEAITNFLRAQETKEEYMERMGFSEIVGK
jgi:hypothetical protein